MPIIKQLLRGEISEQKAKRLMNENTVRSLSETVRADEIDCESVKKRIQALGLDCPEDV
jgi:hypothetical protein